MQYYVYQYYNGLCGISANPKEGLLLIGIRESLDEAEALLKEFLLQQILQGKIKRNIK